MKSSAGAEAPRPAFDLRTSSCQCVPPSFHTLSLPSYDILSSQYSPYLATSSVSLYESNDHSLFSRLLIFHILIIH